MQNNCFTLVYSRVLLFFGMIISLPLCAFSLFFVAASCVHLITCVGQAVPFAEPGRRPAFRRWLEGLEMTLRLFEHKGENEWVAEDWNLCNLQRRWLLALLHCLKIRAKTIIWRFSFLQNRFSHRRSQWSNLYELVDCDLWTASTCSLSCLARQRTTDSKPVPIKLFGSVDRLAVLLGCRSGVWIHSDPATR